MSPLVMSNGLGVESQAIFERWLAEPETRPFTDWTEIIVIVAQVGEERKDTVALFEKRTLPILRELGVRFVEVARRGHLEEDGIVVLQDTRSPERLHPEGRYKLTDELLSSGTVPQVAGEHRCAMKFKAFPIETWLAYEFRGCGDFPVQHVFGYNADEASRAEKSDAAIAGHNRDRSVAISGPVYEVFGFNGEEVGRIERAKAYDGPHRVGLYPLQAWGWNRKKCLDYILEKSGLAWEKSACAGCPFCREAAAGEAAAVERWNRYPDQTAHWLMVEHNSLCFNPRGQLYARTAMIDVVRKAGTASVLGAFDVLLAESRYGLYRVRRIYTAKGKAMRSVERLAEGDLKEMAAQFHTVAAKLVLRVERKRGIAYAYLRERAEGVYPSAEGFFVVAPLFMSNKVRGSQAKFDQRWGRVIKGLPVNEEAAA